MFKLLAWTCSPDSWFMHFLHWTFSQFIFSTSQFCVCLSPSVDMADFRHRPAGVSHRLLTALSCLFSFFLWETAGFGNWRQICFDWRRIRFCFRDSWRWLCKEIKNGALLCHYCFAGELSYAKLLHAHTNCAEHSRESARRKWAGPVLFIRLLKSRHGF